MKNGHAGKSELRARYRIRLVPVRKIKQRVKSVASVLAEEFLRQDTSRCYLSFTDRAYAKADVQIEFMDVSGNKNIEPIGERRIEFLRHHTTS